MAEFENETASALDLPDVCAEQLDVSARQVRLRPHALSHEPQAGDRLHAEYNTDLFDEATVDGFLAAFREVLTAAVHDPATPLSRLAPEPRAVQPAAPRSLHEAFAAQAAARPDEPAVIGADGAVVTYRQLDERAGRLAALLLSRGARPGAVVGLWVPRSAELVVAMLAVLRTGAAFLPLDPANARQRLRSVVAESGTRLLVASDPDDLAGLNLDATVIGVTAAETAAEPPGPAAEPYPASPEDAAYVIYTSGSTGRPKGVVVPHSAVLNLCQWQRWRFGFTADDRSAMVCSQSFDASVLEVWPSLTTGASIAVVPERERLDLPALARWYAEAEVTFSALPTAMGSEFLALPADRQPPLRAMLLGGDTLRRKPRPGTPYEVVNIYGPTETTVLVTTHSVPAGDPDDRSAAPVGHAVDNTRLLVLDDRLAPVAPGEPGELYVGGAGVAWGYLNRPDLTAERFLPDPSGGPGRVYRTGDRVRRLADGALEFIGRADDQVKIRGYRVEPGESTHALLGLRQVRDAVVLARRDEDGEASLVGYVVPRPDLAPGARDGFLAEVRGRLADLLPDYLVPTAWVVLDALPLGGNGKLDRAALPDPAGHRPDPGPATDIAATEEAVRKLWAAELKLGLAEVAADASFFDLGGHSINAMRLLNRVRDTFGLDYPMLDFFLEPTPGAMAKKLGDGSLGQGERGAPRERLRLRPRGTQ